MKFSFIIGYITFPSICTYVSTKVDSYMYVLHDALASDPLYVFEKYPSIHDLHGYFRGIP